MMICGGNPVFLFIEIVRALKNAENHFREIDKIRKIAVFWTILFSKVEKRINLILSHCNGSLLFFIQQK